MTERRSRADLPAAVILAAGRGSRLKQHTRDRPKCLLEIGGRSIIEHQIRALRLAGVDSIQVITGYGAEQVRRICGSDVSYAHNEHFDTTNSFDSLGCATLNPGPLGFLILNSDVLFHPELLVRLLDDPRENVLLADYTSTLAQEEMKISVDASRRITAISKSIEPSKAQAENLGVLRIGGAAALRMLELSRNRELSPSRIAWLPDGIHFLREAFAFHALSVEALPWTEIDFEQDLLRARNEIYPLVREALWGSKPVAAAERSGRTR